MANGDISINENATTKYAEEIISAGRFEKGVMSPDIGKGTLSADRLCEESFDSEQISTTFLGEALYQDAERIKGVGASFALFDQMLSELMVIKAWNKKREV